MILTEKRPIRFTDVNIDLVGGSSYDLVHRAFQDVEGFKDRWVPCNNMWWPSDMFDEAREQVTCIICLGWRG